MSVPGFIHKLNGQFLPEHFELSGITGGLIYVCLFLLYPTGKFIMGIKFWRISQVIYKSNLLSMEEDVELYVLLHF